MADDGVTKPVDAEALVVIEEQDSLALVRLARASKRNALTRAMLERLTEIFEGFAGRRDLRAVVLCGEGREAFCAGTDIAELAALDEEAARRVSERGQRACEAIERCGVPVVAAIEGAAAGGGFELALACHLRIASAEARFSLPETRLGLIPGYGGTQRLARAIGDARALSLMLAHESLAADEALRVGLVNRVVEAGETVAEAVRLARVISEQSAPLAVRACLEAVTRGARVSLDEGLALEAALFSRLFSTRDVREGTRAFLEKRPPVFTGE